MTSSKPLEKKLFLITGTQQDGKSFSCCIESADRAKVFRYVQKQNLILPLVDEVEKPVGTVIQL